MKQVNEEKNTDLLKRGGEGQKVEKSENTEITTLQAIFGETYGVNKRQNRGLRGEPSQRRNRDFKQRRRNAQRAWGGAGSGL